jgi:hypothetical protein
MTGIIQIGYQGCQDKDQKREKAEKKRGFKAEYGKQKENKRSKIKNYPQLDSEIAINDFILR